MVEIDHDDDIQVGDFGLSKFNSPEGHMDLPCGTLAYVAPEVLAGGGYGKEVDLWSLGVKKKNEYVISIMYNNTNIYQVQKIRVYVPV